MDLDEHIGTRPSEYSENLPTASQPDPPPIASRSMTPAPRPTERGRDLDKDLEKEVLLTADSEVSVGRAAGVDGTGVSCGMPKDPTSEPVFLPTATILHQLPEDVRACLEAIENNLIQDHTRFSKALKTQQFPLVQSLGDVFIDNVRQLLLFVCHH